MANDTTPTVGRHKLRWYQCSLRSLLLVVSHTPSEVCKPSYRDTVDATAGVRRRSRNSSFQRAVVA
jgi:hypothetical protein